MNRESVRSALRMVAFIALVTCCAVPGLEAQNPGQSDDRKNTIVVYLWGASIEGDDGLVKDFSLGGPVLGAGFRF